MKKNQQSRNGFTILEILVVVVIIIVLAGMVFRMMGVVGRTNEEANTRKVLEKVANALEEFRATYGKYPPVHYYPGVGQPLEYEYPLERLMSTIAPQLKNASKDENIWQASGEGRIFTFGLMSFLFPRYNSHADASPKIFVGGGVNESTGKPDTYNKTLTINQWADFNERTKGYVGDLKQNLESSRRILPFLDASLGPDDQVVSRGIARVDWVARTYGNLAYTNFYIHIWDGWDRDILYESRPPYDTYKLWSKGADGDSGTPDDLIAGKE